jgi:hypothetical protein
MRAIGLAILLMGTVVLAVGCAEERSYPETLADDAHNLGAMSLQGEDLPAGFEKQSPGEFANEAWAAIMDEEDVEARLRQLEAQGRLRNYVSLFGPRGLGPVLGVTAISTLYADAGAAERSLREYACGLPIDATVQLEPLLVPALGDGTSGFLVRQFEDGAPTFVDATICFRTGRVVHAIQTTSLTGAQDIAFLVRLAERMKARTDVAFAEATKGG